MVGGMYASTITFHICPAPMIMGKYDENAQATAPRDDSNTERPSTLSII